MKGLYCHCKGDTSLDQLEWYLWENMGVAPLHVLETFKHCIGNDSSEILGIG